jgi:Ca2+:H+ antiporter
MPNSASLAREPALFRVVRAWGTDVWLWLGTILSAVVAAWARFTGAGQVAEFLAALVGVAFTATVMSRALDQVTGRLSPSAVGLFQAVTGNIPELVIGAFALVNHLDAVVLGTIAGSALNLLLFANAAAYIAGGIRHRVLTINTQLALPPCVMLVLMVTVLVMPAVAVRLHTAAQGHQQAVSYTVAIVLLTVFLIALPENLRSSAPGQNEGPTTAWLAGLGTSASSPERPGAAGGPHGSGRPQPDAREAERLTVGRWPLPITLALLGLSGLLLAEEADWLTDPMGGALAHLHISQTFAGLFILAVVNNLSQVGPAVQFALHGDIDTAIAINLQGALQLVLMVAPVLMLMASVTGAHHFTLIFSPLMAVAMVAATLLVVFVVLDAVANVLEGVMLLGLYVVLASLFAWS